MFPLRRLVAILACASFLVTGGLGASARVYICTDSNGEVHVEMPFSRCCDGDQQQHHEANHAVHEVSAVSASDDCGLCTDDVVSLGKDHTASLRTLKLGNSLEPHLVLLPSLLLPDNINITAAAALAPCRVPAVAAHAPVEAVVLRC